MDSGSGGSSDDRRGFANLRDNRHLRGRQVTNQKAGPRPLVIAAKRLGEDVCCLEVGLDVIQLN